MNLFLLVKLIHVASAIWSIAGLLGRWYALDAAARASDIRITRAYTDLSGVFENKMVIPGSMVLLVSGIVAAFLGGFPLLGPLQGGPWWLAISLLLFFATMAMVPTIFLPRGRAFAAALEDAITRGEVTARLRAAFGEPTVVRAHMAELVGVAIVLVLMVLKPF